jgi:hypothetical protein
MSCSNLVAPQYSKEKGESATEREGSTTPVSLQQHFSPVLRCMAPVNMLPARNPRHAHSRNENNPIHAAYLFDLRTGSLAV